MERHLVIILIFTGLIHFVLSDPRKYYLIQQPKTWNDSQVYCRANHEDLAVIESVENVIRFQSDMKKQNFTSSAWIGLYSDVNNWRWSLGNEPVGSSKLWAAVWGQPNNAERNEFCVIIDNYGWLDATCALLLRFVCFDGEEENVSILCVCTVTVTRLTGLTYTSER
ncbi:C-type lectin lectoxin-Phi1-like [Silurus meridionalis]|uniref:C-type lectin lectoxin-Phi1-like n=1 Tax=Silurus meridionalis TaxID=175797 RepID=UPI001EEA0228|nr:C-type lectin lectoxin-Phi1-like [Silurus meridionalis]